MIQLLKKLFSGGTQVNFTELVANGATILDVRTKGEYASGHIKGSINIPVDQLASNLGRFQDKHKPIITCCASGMRSGSAKSMLTAKGYTQVYNGGGWSSLKNKL